MTEDWRAAERTRGWTMGREIIGTAVAVFPFAAAPASSDPLFTFAGG